MKKLVLGLISTILFNLTVNAQTTDKDWFNIINTYKTSLDKVLLSECPKDLELQKFKILVINGEQRISDKAKSEIQKLVEPLKSYGKEFAQRNNLTVEDESDYIFYSSFTPSLPVNGGSFDFTTNDLTGGEIGYCAAVAIGVDFMWAVGSSTAASWSIAAITRAFRSIASRFLGPVGVAIAVGAFSWCLYEHY